MKLFKKYSYLQMKTSLSEGIPYLEMLSHDKVVPSKDKDCHTSGQDEQREPISRYFEQGTKRNRAKTVKICTWWVRKSLQKWKLYKHQPLLYFNLHGAPRPIVKKENTCRCVGPLGSPAGPAGHGSCPSTFYKWRLEAKVCSRSFKGKLLFSF